MLILQFQFACTKVMYYCRIYNASMLPVKDHSTGPQRCSSGTAGGGPKREPADPSSPAKTAVKWKQLLFKWSQN